MLQNSKYDGPLEPARPCYYTAFQQYFASGHYNNRIARGSGSVAGMPLLR
jgi:hypothetical protein